MRLVPVLLLVAIMLAPTAMALRPFHAELTLPDPVRVTGALTLEKTGVLGALRPSTNWSGVGAPFFSANDVKVRFWEIRSAPSAWGPDEQPLPILRPIPPRAIVTHSSLGTVKVAATEVGPEARILFAAPLASTANTLSALGGCDVSTTPIGRGAFLGGLYVPAGADLGILADGVHASCPKASLVATRIASLTLYGMRLTLVDEKGVQRGYQTGTSVEEHSGGTLHLASRVVRFLEVEAAGAGSATRLDLAGRVNLSLSSPRFTFAGDLGIPKTAMGSVEWAGWTGPASELPGVPRGSFEFAVDPDQRLIAQGTSTNAPSSPRSGALESMGWAALAAFAVAGGVLTLLASRLLHPFLARLFTRIKNHEALDQPRRRLLVEFVRHNPGAIPKEAAKALDVTHNAILHHVRVLARSQVLTVRHVGQQIALFERGRFSPADQMALFLLRLTRVQELLRLLRAWPEATQDDLSVRLGVSQPQVSNLLSRLERSGLVSSRRDGRRRRYVVEAQARLLGNEPVASAKPQTPTPAAASSAFAAVLVGPAPGGDPGTAAATLQ